MPAKKDDVKKVFDVAKPGKTAASSSSRPLIIGHKPILKDPMVKDETVSEMDENKEVKIDKPLEEDQPSGNPALPSAEEVEENAETKAIAPSEAKVVIEPLSEDDKKEAEPTEVEQVEEPTAPILPDASMSDEPEDDGKIAVKVNKSSAKTTKKEAPKIAEVAAAKAAKMTTDEAAKAGDAEEAPAASEPAPEEEPAKEDSAASETTDESKPDDEAEEKPDDQESDSNDSVSDDSKSDSGESNSAATEAQKKAEKEQQAEDAKKEQVQKLIDNKQYAVPIGEKTRKKRSVHNILLGMLLILLLGGVLVYLMMDVGMIKSSINLPYHFFKQDSAISSLNSTPATTTQANTKSTTPSSTTKTYTSKNDSFSFVYPASWKSKDSSKGTNDFMNVYTPEDQNSTKLFTVNYSRPSVVNQALLASTSFKVLYVKYSDTKLTINNRKIYLRDIVYQTKLGYAAKSSLTDAKGTEKVGDSISGDKLSPLFLSKDDTTKATFEAGFSWTPGDQETAVNYIQSSEAQQYKNILLSGYYKTN